MVNYDKSFLNVLGQNTHLSQRTILYIKSTVAL